MAHEVNDGEIMKRAVEHFLAFLKVSCDGWAPLPKDAAQPTEREKALVSANHVAARIAVLALVDHVLADGDAENALLQHAKRTLLAFSDGRELPATVLA